MNKKNMVAAMAAKTGLTQKDCEKALDAFTDTICETLVAGGKVHLTDLGTFEVKDRAGRTGRNLYTRESVDIPPYKAPVFHAGKSLKEAVH